ncbi:MAG: ABC transporter ATP-binding protein [Firmicutes bacterium]|nr:ABC transporter ATP-binding protein [Bacillota bacterium]MCL5039607.1 ABC transporter ATP-binding protein [Bacillota bacterium]
MTSLLLENLFFTYGSHFSLEGVSSHWHGGQVVAILGPNGTGKSTLLRALTGLVTPKSGFIKLNGRDLKSYPWPERAKRISYLPQNDGTLPSLPVFEAILLGRRPQFSWFLAQRDLEATEKAIRTLELEPYQFRPVGELSGGERQKVFLARALAQETEVILLDEPTNSLDPAYQLLVFEVLRQMADGGRLVVMVLHDLNLANQHADMVLLLAKGRLLAAGPPGEVLTPANLEKAYGVEVLLPSIEGKSYIVPHRRIGPGKGVLHNY